MIDYRIIEQRLFEVLGLQRRPVAVAFRESAPAGISRFTGTQPSGCSFWRIAAGGQTFYTVPSDHYNCAIGSYTHNLTLQQDRAHELDQTLSFMAGVGYIKMEEVANIPRLPQPPGVVIYAPLADTPVEPDVVLFPGPAWTRDAAAGSRLARRRRRPGSPVRAPHLYGASCRPGLRRRCQHGVYREPRLHRHGGGRTVRCSSWKGPVQNCRRGANHRRCQRRVVPISPPTSGNAGHGVIRLR